jgi:hypothetical protein
MPMCIVGIARLFAADQHHKLKEAFESLEPGSAGFETQLRELSDLAPVKRRLVSPTEMTSCHTHAGGLRRPVAIWPHPEDSLFPCCKRLRTKGFFL